MQSARRPLTLLSLYRSSPAVLTAVSCRNVRGRTVPADVTAKEQQKHGVPTPFALNPRNEPAYIKYTPEQKDWFWRGMLRQRGILIPREMQRDKYPIPEILQKQPEKQVDPEAEPFRHIYEGNDGSNFSGAEVVKDENIWFWVQRILPDNSPPDMPRTDCRDRMPSGWIPPPITPPDRPYFVRRLWNGLFPVSKHLHKRNPAKLHLKKIDEHVFDPNPEVNTILELVDGDIRQLELELVEHIQKLKKRRVLTSVSEFEAKIVFKGNHVEVVVHWLEDNGF